MYLEVCIFGNGFGSSAITFQLLWAEWKNTITDWCQTTGVFWIFKEARTRGLICGWKGLSVLSWSSGNQLHTEMAKERNSWGTGASVCMRCTEQPSHQLALPLLMTTLGRRGRLWTLKWIVNYSCLLSWMEETCISGARPRIHYLPLMCTIKITLNINPLTLFLNSFLLLHSLNRYKIVPLPYFSSILILPSHWLFIQWFEGPLNW